MNKHLEVRRLVVTEPRCWKDLSGTLFYDDKCGTDTQRFGKIAIDDNFVLISRMDGTKVKYFNKRYVIKINFDDE